MRLRDAVGEICAQRELLVVKGNIWSNHMHIPISAPGVLVSLQIAQYLKA